MLYATPLMSGQKVITFFENNNLQKKITIKLKPKEKLTYFIYIIAKKNVKDICINIDQLNASKCEFNINCVALDKGQINININNNVIKNIKNCVIKQNINGLILDNDSLIKVYPTMQINNNLIHAEHSVNIGNLNKEKLYFLMSRKFTKAIATAILIKDMFSLVDEKKYISILNQQSISKSL
jgi:Fe-S cluster assembly scaffold protein SufB